MKFPVQLLILITIIAVTASAGCKKKNACDTVSCNNAGTCVDGACQCDSLHEGAFCETEKRSRYIGSFVGRESCNSRNHLDYISIYALPGNGGDLNFHNLYGSESDVTGTMQADGTVHLPEQWLLSNTISGTAYISNEKIVIDFTVTDGSFTDTCRWAQQW